MFQIESTSKVSKKVLPSLSKSTHQFIETENAIGLSKCLRLVIEADKEGVL